MTQKTLTQNRRSLEANSPTLNGAMYHSQDQSKSSNEYIKTIEDPIIDLTETEVPNFVKSLKTKYGTTQ